MSPLKKVQLLLDENVSHRLIPFLNQISNNVSTVQAQGGSGYKYGRLAQQIKQQDYVLLTRDKDFIFMWRTHQIKVIYLQIHPPVLSELILGLKNLFNNWTYDLDDSFLIIVQKDSIRSWH